MGTLALGLALILSISLTASVGIANPMPSPKLRVRWSDSTFEEALANLVCVANGKLSIIGDSYRGNHHRTTLPEFEGSVDDAVSRLARMYKRQVIQKDGVYILRHSQWFDPELPATGAVSNRDTPKQRLTLRASTVDGSTRFSLDCRSASISSLASLLGKATKEAHHIALPLRIRRVSGKVEEVTADELRAIIAELFIDAYWRRRGTSWSLEERPTAGLVRLIAKEGHGHGLAVRSALYTQAAAALTPTQLQQLKTTGSVQINWGQLPPSARDLFVQWTDRMRAMIARSDGRTDLFIDHNQKDKWGVEFVTRPDGSLHPRSTGPSLTGSRVIF